VKYFFLIPILFLFTLPRLLFATPVSFEDALRHYEQKDFRILIVPGHSNREWGTDFRGLRESALNVKLATNLAEFLKRDPHIKVYMARDEYGSFANWLSYYFQAEATNTKKFLALHSQASKAAVENGTFKLTSGVYHNRASSQTAYELFAINKFANDNRIDLTLHIHFNDNPGRKINQPGKYAGVAIYVPERQLPNFFATEPFAKAILSKLNQLAATSTFPGERAGVVQDQELIAIGSSGTREGAALLIEYGYIYEPQFLLPTVRDAYVRELAYLTFHGIENVFPATLTSSTLAPSVLLPRVWPMNMRRGMKNVDVLTLQRALSITGYYPPFGMSLQDCPVSGYFGACTELGLNQFTLMHKVAIDQLDPKKSLRARTLELLSSLVTTN